MSKVNLAIIYYSATGTNYQLSNWASEGALEADAEVRILKVPELAPQSVIESNPDWKSHRDETSHIPEVALGDIEWADAILFSIPTRFGNMPSQVKQFLDTTGGLWFHGKTANKVVSAMASAENPHGGQEAAILSLYTSMYHWGAIVASPGYLDSSIFKAGGNPYGTSVTVTRDGKMKEDVKEAVKFQARRTTEVARWVKLGKQ